MASPSLLGSDDEAPLLDDTVEGAVDYKARPARRFISGGWRSACFIIGKKEYAHSYTNAVYNIKSASECEQEDDDGDRVVVFFELVNSCRGCGEVRL